MDPIPFLVGSSACGLPRSIPLQKGTGNFGPLPGDTTATAYWLLRELAVAYSYTIGGWGAFSGNISCSDWTEPLDRLLIPPNFSYENVQPTDGRFQEFQLTPGNVFGGYFLKIILKDGSYPYGEILLTSEFPTANQSVLDILSVPLLGHPLTLRLVTTVADPPITGSIDFCTFTADFWEF
jgi:hypothetical protein